jgi:hypothetical protein
LTRKSEAFTPKSEAFARKSEAFTLKTEAFTSFFEQEIRLTCCKQKKMLKPAVKIDKDFPCGAPYRPFARLKIACFID